MENPSVGPADQAAAERERLPGLLVIYRDNDLFQKHMPAVVAGLRAAERTVNVQAFPAGTPETDIENWFEANRASIGGQELVPDGTAYKTILKSLRKKAHGDADVLFRMNQIWTYKSHSQSGGEKGKDEYLDSFFNEVTARAVFGEDFDLMVHPEQHYEYTDVESERAAQKEREMRLCQESFIRLTRAIFENDPDAVPKKVYVALYSISSHSPFGTLERELGERGSPNPQQEIAERLRGWLVEGGIPEAAFEIIRAVNAQNRAEIDQEGTWIIRDRHRGEAPGTPGFSHAKELVLPFSSFFESAVAKGLLDFDSKKIEGVMRQILKRDFRRTISEREDELERAQQGASATR